MKTTRLLSMMILAISGVSVSAMAGGPNPAEVYIKRITYAGNGCPQGSVASKIAFDAKTFTLLFDEYLAEVGPNVPGGFAERNCKVVVDLRVPHGWSYTIFSVDYRGFTALDSNVLANQTSKYYFQSRPEDYSIFRSNFSGPLNEDYFFTDEIEMDELVWSPCGVNRALNIETSINVSNHYNPLGFGQITVDSMDGALAHIYGIQWERCI